MSSLDKGLLSSAAGLFARNLTGRCGNVVLFFKLLGEAQSFGCGLTTGEFGRYGRLQVRFLVVRNRLRVLVDGAFVVRLLLVILLGTALLDSSRLVVVDGATLLLGNSCVVCVSLELLLSWMVHLAQQAGGSG